MPIATLNVELGSEEAQLIEDCARSHGMSAPEFLRVCALERIEDELDLEAWHQAKEEFDREPVMVSASDVGGCL